MLKLNLTTQFKHDLKLCKKQDYNINLLNGKCEFLLHPDAGHSPFYRVPPETRPDGHPSAASIETG